MTIGSIKEHFWGALKLIGEAGKDFNKQNNQEVVETDGKNLFSVKGE